MKDRPRSVRTLREEARRAEQREIQREWDKQLQRVWNEYQAEQKLIESEQQFINRCIAD